MAFSVVKFGLNYAKLGAWAVPGAVAVAWAGWPALSYEWRARINPFYTIPKEAMQ